MSNTAYSVQDEGFTPGPYFNAGVPQAQQFFGNYPALDAASSQGYGQLPLGQYNPTIQNAPERDVNHQHRQVTGVPYGWQANDLSSQPLYHDMNLMAGNASDFQTSYAADAVPMMPPPLDPALYHSSMYSNTQTLSQEQMPLSAFAPALYDFARQQQAFEQMNHRPLSMVQPYGILQPHIAGM